MPVERSDRAAFSPLVIVLGALCLLSTLPFSSEIKSSIDFFRSQRILLCFFCEFIGIVSHVSKKILKPSLIRIQSGRTANRRCEQIKRFSDKERHVEKFSQRSVYGTGIFRRCVVPQHLGSVGRTCVPLAVPKLDSG